MSALQRITRPSKISLIIITSGRVEFLSPEPGPMGFLAFILCSCFFQLKMTPLHWATEKGHLDVIEILLKAGADVACENKVCFSVILEQ